VETSPEDLSVRTKGPYLSGEFLEGRLEKGRDLPPAVRTKRGGKKETGIGALREMAKDFLFQKARPLHAGPRKERQQRLLDLPDRADSPGERALLLLSLRNGTSPWKERQAKTVLLGWGISDQRQKEAAAARRPLLEVPALVPGEKGQTPFPLLLQEGALTVKGLRSNSGPHPGAPVAKFNTELEAEPFRKMGDEGDHPPVNLGDLVLVCRKHVDAGERK
jgi:hypothetical protein